MRALTCVLLALAGAFEGMCLDDTITDHKLYTPDQRRNFTFGDYNGALKMYTLLWSSARVANKIGKTVLQEIFGYHVDDSLSGWNNGDQIQALAGCVLGTKDHPTDCMTPEGQDIFNPRAYVGFEAWKGVGREGVPIEIMPEIAGKLEYLGEEGVYMPPYIAEKFYQKGRIVTNWMGFNGNVYNDFTDHFQTLRDLMQIDTFKSGAGLSDIGTLPRVMDQYLKLDESDKPTKMEKFTPDSSTALACYDITTGVLSQVAKDCGGVWVAPLSRADPLGCIPIISSSDWGYFLVPMAAKYLWPVCYMTVGWADYVYMGSTYDVLFYWWTPDVTFMLRNMTELTVMKYDGLAEEAGDFTAARMSPLEVLAWQFLREGDEGRGQFIAKFQFNIAWYDADANMWMAQAASGVGNEDVACNWLRANVNRWKLWIPAMEPPCQIGNQLDATSGNCRKCRAGTYASEANRDRIIWDCLSCDPGTAQKDEGQGECDQCEPGSFAAMSKQTACTQCSPGEFQRAVAQSQCNPCAPGSFAGDPGSASCELCPHGTYQDKEGQTECVVCPESFTTNDIMTDASEKCTCKKDRFWNRATDMCDECPPQGVCPGGFDPPTVRTGRYGVYVGKVSDAQQTSKELGMYEQSKDAFEELLVYNCRRHECTTTPGVCVTNRVGVACAICKEGFYPLPECTECAGGGGTFGLLIVLILAFPFILWSGCIATSKPYATKVTAALQFAGTFGIMVLFMQILGTMSMFNVVWPLWLPSFLNIGKIFLFDLEGLGVGCIVGNNFLAQYCTAFLLPVLIGGVMAGLVPLSRFLPRIGRFDTRLKVDSAINFLGMLYSALYISLVKMVVAYFECVPNPAAADTLAKYKEVICYSSEHSAATPVMVLGMLVYVVGFFCLCFWLNVKAPSMFVNARFRARCKFLVDRWRADVWYWGIVYMMRNLAVAFVAVISSLAIDQFVIMGVAMLIFLVLTASYMPWKDVRLAQFDNMISFILVFTTSCGLGFTYLALDIELATSEKVRKDSESRLQTYTVLITLAMALAPMGFIALAFHVIFWMKNMKKMDKAEEEENCLLNQRWEVTLQHDNFQEQFERYIATGTHYDIGNLTKFMDTMETRLGGLDTFGAIPDELRTSIKKQRHSQRLMADASSGAAAQSKKESAI